MTTQKLRALLQALPDDAHIFGAEASGGYGEIWVTYQGRDFLVAEDYPGLPEPDGFTRLMSKLTNE